MGNGNYDHDSRSVRASTSGYATKSNSELFSSSANKDFLPKSIEIRESRDSEEHPVSTPVVIAFDVTASMGSIPRALINNGIPKIVKSLMQLGVKNPQIMVIAIGDDFADRVPIQVSQFESSDELIDKDLQSIWLESGGGGNSGESYYLAWHFASNYVVSDHFEKRGKRGILFTIGDEPCLLKSSASARKKLFFADEGGGIDAIKALESCREKFNVFHVNCSYGNGNRAYPNTVALWKKLIGEDLVDVSDLSELIEKTCNKISNIVSSDNIVVDSPQADQTKTFTPQESSKDFF